MKMMMMMMMMMLMIMMMVATAITYILSPVTGGGPRTLSVLRYG